MAEPGADPFDDEVWNFVFYCGNMQVKFLPVCFGFEAKLMKRDLKTCVREVDFSVKLIRSVQTAVTNTYRKTLLSMNYKANISNIFILLFKIISKLIKK